MFKHKSPLDYLWAFVVSSKRVEFVVTPLKGAIVE